MHPAITPWLDRGCTCLPKEGVSPSLRGFRIPLTRAIAPHPMGLEGLGGHMALPAQLDLLEVKLQVTQKTWKLCWVSRKPY